MSAAIFGTKIKDILTVNAFYIRTAYDIALDQLYRVPAQRVKTILNMVDFDEPSYVSKINIPKIIAVERD